MAIQEAVDTVEAAEALFAEHFGSKGTPEEAIQWARVQGLIRPGELAQLAEVTGLGEPAEVQHACE